MSEHENNLIGGERELESALRALRPNRDHGKDPIRLAFTAGQRSVARSARRWKYTGIAACALACAAFAVPPMTRRDHPGVPLVAQASIAQGRMRPLSELSALKMRIVALDRGLDALPRPDGMTAAPMRVVDGSEL